MRITEILSDVAAIKKWLDDHGVDKETYTINNDGSISSAPGRFLYLQKRNIVGKLPFRIREVSDGLSLSENYQLTSLEGVPSHIKGDFDMAFCKKLTSFEHGPEKVDGGVNATWSGLTSLKGCPKIINRHFDCDSCKITEIDDTPEHISEDWNLANNQITSLKGIEKLTRCDGSIYLSGNPIRSSVLGLLKIQNLTNVYFSPSDPEPMIQALNIIKKHLGKGRAGMIDAQQELMDNGLDEFAE